jgi:hypothetical protein
MLREFNSFSNAFSAYADDRETATSDQLAHERREFSPLLVSESQNLADHRDGDAVGAELERPINFAFERRSIDSSILSERRLHHRQHAVQWLIN